MSVDTSSRKALKSGHPRAQVPLISIHEDGRLRVAHLMALFACGHNAFYSRLDKGFIPPPDGRDPRPYWLTSTVRPFLTGQSASQKTPK